MVWKEIRNGVRKRNGGRIMELVWIGMEGEEEVRGPRYERRDEMLRQEAVYTGDGMKRGTED